MTLAEQVSELFNEAKKLFTGPLDNEIEIKEHELVDNKGIHNNWNSYVGVAYNNRFKGYYVFWADGMWGEAGKALPLNFQRSSGFLKSPGAAGVLMNKVKTAMEQQKLKSTMVKSKLKI